MNTQLCALLWSKYSPMCKKLLDALQSSPINLTNTIGLTLVCIDNEEIRKRIMTANKIDISIVPCVIVVYTNGLVEKYEGIQAAQWCEEIVKKYIPEDVIQASEYTVGDSTSPPDMEDINTAVKPKSSRPIHSKQSRQSRQSNRNYKTSKTYKKDRKYRVKNQDYNIDTDSNTETESEDRVSETDTEDLQEESRIHSNTQNNIKPKRPPAMIRNGPSGYDVTEEIGEIEETNRDMGSHTRATTQPVVNKANDLMARATAMQKEREKAEPRDPRAVKQQITQ